ncbi:hypothetical protein BE221DRAFT_61534 [Ostreococcus tauri]|uniref:Uncharacterized protein n=1 Tax=Ostreococcus tauri TaxID=70448 RepID=A0A1Y5I616_OSTTA|nr:hypothetical protein BE221DRAFT_61534 [Ostreococcus tauri]
MRAVSARNASALFAERVTNAKSATKTTRRARVVTSASAFEVARVVLAAPTMYALVSANEYVTHRYYQHAEFNKNETLKKVWCTLTGKKEAPKIGGGGHIEHHAETLDDMSLRVDDKWMKSEPAKILVGNKYRGTAFNWDVTGLMLGQMVITCVPVLSIMGYGFVAQAALITTSTLVHAAVWNSLHPAMHGLNEIPMSEVLRLPVPQPHRSPRHERPVQLQRVLPARRPHDGHTRVPFGKEHRAFYPAGEYARNLAAKAAGKVVEEFDGQASVDEELVAA